ncbi:MAG: toluene tolerance family protein, partial [Alphaproteobacteria bacterium]|nr:toluene tolerance family protein [Alphaproteobacteria bacterium]
GFFMHRRSVLLGAGAFAALPVLPAFAANAAEAFIAANIQVGFDILNDKTLDVAARKQRFAAFLLGLTDVKRVALFLIGKYAAGASQADMDAYLAAYQDYVAAVYQSYFAQYAGQSLRVASSRERAKDDFVVATNLTGSNTPMQIEFRVRTDGAKPVLVDLSVAGVWLAVAQRDEFTSVLSQSNGDIKALTAHLRTAEKLYR